MNRPALLFFILCFEGIHAQGSKEAELLSGNKEWYEGSILLIDGEELKGLVRYDDHTSLLAYHDGENSKTFSERRVLGFEFFDERIQKQRTFYCLEFEDPDMSIKKPVFFEVLRDYKTFAILIKADPIEAKQKIRGGPGFSIPGPMMMLNPTGSYSTKVEVSQTETVYIMNDKGDILPYFKITNTEDGTKSIFNGKDTKTTNKMIEEDVIIEYVTKPIHEKLVAFAKENDLHFSKKTDFIKILAYYDTLR